MTNITTAINLGLHRYKLNLFGSELLQKHPNVFYLRCQTASSLWTLGCDQPVHKIVKVNNSIRNFHLGVDYIFTPPTLQNSNEGGGTASNPELIGISALKPQSIRGQEVCSEKQVLCKSLSMNAIFSFH